MIDKNKIKKILVIRNDHIGDLIFSTGVFRELKKQFPKAEITAVVSPISKALIEKNKNINEIITIEHGKKFFKSIPRYFRIWRQISKQKYDVGIDLRGDFISTFFLMYLTGVKYKIGFGKKSITKRFLDFFLNKDVKKHETDLSLELINRGLGINSKNSWPEIVVSREDIREANKFIKKNKLKKFICIVPDSDHPLKQWPLEKFDKIIKHIKKKYTSHRIVLVGADSDKLNWLMNKNPGLLKLDKVNLRMLYPLFKRSSLVITLDVGPMHIAWVGNSKLLGLILKFSRPSIKNIMPLGKNSKFLLEKDKEITIKEVMKATNKILKNLGQVKDNKVIP